VQLSAGALLDGVDGVTRLPVSKHAATSIFARYPARVAYEGGEIGHFGYGSLPLARYVMPFGDSKLQPAIEVGALCEVALGCNILLGGEHFSARTFNGTLSMFPEAARSIAESSPDRPTTYSRGRVTIGSGVTISHGVTILSGVSIGDGAVIGAGAVVTKDVPAFAVVAGSPARLIKMRFDESTIEAAQRIRWWDFTAEAIAKHIGLIDALPSKAALDELMEAAPHCYRPATSNALLYAANTRPDGTRPVVCIGAYINGKHIATNDLPPAFQFYIRQVEWPATHYYLVKDIFEYCGLGSA
jgi:acetyltransferase-like isoleucine patch superfamily enzyme